MWQWLRIQGIKHTTSTLTDGLFAARLTDYFSCRTMLYGVGNACSYGRFSWSLIGGFHVTSSPPCWWTVIKRSLISSLCLSTSICSFHHGYLCLPRLRENHLLVKETDISAWAFPKNLTPTGLNVRICYKERRDCGQKFNNGGRPLNYTKRFSSALNNVVLAITE